MQRLLAALTVAAFLLTATAGVQAQTLTTDPPNNGSGGVWFDLTPNAGELLVTQFDVPYSGTVGTFVDVEVWTRPGSYVGHTDDPAGWTLTQTVTGERMGTTVWSPLVLTSPITLPAGETTGIYLQALEASGIRYTGTGANPPTTTFSNADLTLFGAHATTASTAFGGTPFTPRTFSGVVHYIPEPATLGLLGTAGLLLLRRRNG